MNAAQQIHQALGAGNAAGYIKTPRNASATKSGPGRRHVDGHTTAVERVKKPGAYGKGLRNWANRKPAKGRI